MPRKSTEEVLASLAPVVKSSTDDDDCHSTAQSLLDTLGTGGETTGDGWDSFYLSLKTEGEYVYRVDIKAPDKGIQVYGHSFAILQDGWYLYILQSFVGAYSFKSWVDGEAEGPDAKFAPSKGAVGLDSKMGNEWIRTLRDGVLGGFENHDAALCSTSLGKLFGGHAAKRMVVMQGLCKQGNRMGFSWRRRALA